MTNPINPVLIIAKRKKKLIRGSQQASSGLAMMLHD